MTAKKITVRVVDYGRKHFMLRWIDPVSGKRKTISSGCPTIRAAHLAANEKEKELNAKAPRGDGSILWADFVAVYESDHLNSISAGGRKRALNVLNVYEKEMAPASIGDITGPQISTYVARLRKNGHRDPTIALHLRTLHAALGFAKDNGHLDEIPQFPKIARVRGKRAKGRPLTDPEFIRFLRAVRLQEDMKRLDRPGRRTWRRLLIGLWLSGLRLDEGIRLEWNAGTFAVDTTGKFPLFRITDQKSGQPQLLPLTPDFGQWLLKTPDESRAGFVFPLAKSRYKDVRNVNAVSKTISEIGEVANIVVSDPRAKDKYASAHDLRRTFGLRWASRVMPAELQALMRHADIQTTMSYYALVSAQGFAEKLWATTKTPNKGNNDGNTNS